MNDLIAHSGCRQHYPEIGIERMGKEVDGRLQGGDLKIENTCRSVQAHGNRLAAWVTPFYSRFRLRMGSKKGAFFILLLEALPRERKTIPSCPCMVYAERFPILPVKLKFLERAPKEVFFLIIYRDKIRKTP
jgi:hypothetical protein